MYISVLRNGPRLHASQEKALFRLARRQNGLPSTEVIVLYISERGTLDKLASRVCISHFASAHCCNRHFVRLK